MTAGHTLPAPCPGLDPGLGGGLNWLTGYTSSEQPHIVST